MGFPVFIKELPDTEIDRGHVTVAVGGAEFVATVALYRAFLERERAKLAAWDRETRAGGAKIVRLRDSGKH